MIDHRGNAVILARAQLMALDPAALETKVQTATYRLLLEALIQYATPDHHQGADDNAARSVMGRAAAVNGVADSPRTAWGKER